MKAVGYPQSLPIDHPESLLDLELPEPQAAGRDLLVEVKAVSVNPVDTKLRQRVAPAAGESRVLGWDAAGVVRAVGPEVRAFRPGDEVWYAGALSRSGSNAELQLVDERIVGRKPRSLDFGRAAALPLTTITAWELLFDRLGLARLNAGERTPGKEALLIIGAGGGVGSVLTQLARRLTDLTVICTAGRPETRNWLLELDAHHVIDHGLPLADQLAALGFPTVKYVASLTETDTYQAQIAEVIAPQGRFALIDDPAGFDATLFKRKSVSIHWEFMFTRAMFQTDDMIAQQRLLNAVADLVDAGHLRTTLAAHYGAINAQNLKRAHALLESGQSRGKIVLEGFATA
ncbi:MAG TPA: zinc-binding alcohol dehydrogenase family protein [Rhodocyclaceae bacterium]|nr:zinc-binding alcohol dehydrogenase family protein [Rhodocyclaceae bacterium]